MQFVRDKKYLKQIFSDHFPVFAEVHPKQITRSGIQRNIEKMLACGTEAMGYQHYRCPTCTSERKVLYTCKSRFCSSCGVAQTGQKGNRGLKMPGIWRMSVESQSPAWGKPKSQQTLAGFLNVSANLADFVTVPPATLLRR
jgi:hypothetical protein